MVATLSKPLVVFSGILLCDLGNLDPSRFRNLARQTADHHFAAEAAEQEPYDGTIFRYQNGQSIPVSGRINRKEKLFGEYGADTNYVAHVHLMEHESGVTFIHFRRLSPHDIVFLKKVLRQMGVIIKREFQERTPV